jgi:hypothetical protein
LLKMTTVLPKTVQHHCFNKELIEEQKKRRSTCNSNRMAKWTTTKSAPPGVIPWWLISLTFGMVCCVFGGPDTLKMYYAIVDQFVLNLIRVAMDLHGSRGSSRFVRRYAIYSQNWKEDAKFGQILVEIILISPLSCFDFDTSSLCSLTTDAITCFRTETSDETMAGIHISCHSFVVNFVWWIAPMMMTYLWRRQIRCSLAKIYMAKTLGTNEFKFLKWVDSLFMYP